MPAQRALLADEERDLLMSAVLSKSPKQVASMALKIDSIKDEIVLNLMGYLMNHYGGQQLQPVATNCLDGGCGASDDTASDQSNAEADCSYSSNVSLSDSHTRPLGLPFAFSSSHDGTLSGSTLSVDCEQPPMPRSRKRRIRGAAGQPMAPIAVLASTGAPWTSSAALACASASERPATAATVSEAMASPVAAGDAERGNVSGALSCSAAYGEVETKGGDGASMAAEPPSTGGSAGLPLIGALPAEAPSADASSDGGRQGFTCSHCGRYFKNGEALKFHMAKHLGVEYQCPLCKQCLKTSNSYSNHMKMHSGYDGHRCTMCMKHFMRRHELVRHVKIVHMGERPFACPECGATFATEWNMVRHRKAMHTSATLPSLAAASTAPSDNVGDCEGASPATVA